MKTLLPILVLLSALSMTGCLKDPPELEYNIFADESVELLTVTKVTFEPPNTSIKDVRVKFSSVYNDLPKEQKTRVRMIRIFKDGIPNAGIQPDRIDFVWKEQEKGKTICFELAFVIENESSSRKNSPYCFTVQ